MKRANYTQEEKERHVELILNVLKAHPEGILASQVGKITEIGSYRATRLLIVLRSNGKVTSTEPGLGRRSVWFISDENHRVEKVNPSATEKPYPNLDDEHEAWVKSVTAVKKRYQPWGKSC